MKSKCNRVAVIAYALVITGCATPFKSIPKTDDDFRLPPEEFKQRFTDVRQYSAEQGSPPLFNFPVADELVSTWGPADQSVIDRPLQYANIANFSGVGLWFFGGVPQIFIPVVGLFGYMAATRPPEILTWSKENYTVDVHTAKRGDARWVTYWQWKYTSLDVTEPVFAPNVGIAPIFKLNFLFAPRFSESHFDANDPGLSGGMALHFGIRHPTLIPNTDTEISVGWRTNGNLDPDTNRQVIARSVPIEMLAMYRFVNSSVRVGGGVSAHLNGKFISNYLSDEKIDPAIGFIGQCDYSIWPRTAIGIRFESLRYQTASGREFNANTIGLTNTTVFW